MSFLTREATAPNLWSDQENRAIGKQGSGPDDWAEDLEAGRLSREQLSALANAYAADRHALSDRARSLVKLARDSELDHRAGQVKSADARATVAIAVAEALQRTLSSDSGGGFLGKLLGGGDRPSSLVNGAASQAHLALGGLARDRGDLVAADREYRAALEAARMIDSAGLATGVAMMELGHNSHLQGREKEAEDWLRQAHPILVHAQGPAYVPLDLYLLGLAQAGMERWDEALATLKVAESDYAQKNVANGVLDSRLAQTDILIRTGHVDDAAHLATETADMAKGLGKPQYMAQARWHLSRIKRAQKKPDEAIDLLNQAIKLYEQAGDNWHRSQSFMAVAEIEQQRGRIEDASRALDQADAIARAMKSPFLEADGTHARAMLRRAAGDDAGARGLLEQAKAMFAAQGRTDQVRIATAQLEQLPE